MNKGAWEGSRQQHIFFANQDSLTSPPVDTKSNNIRQIKQTGDVLQLYSPVPLRAVSTATASGRPFSARTGSHPGFFGPRGGAMRECPNTHTHC